MFADNKNAGVRDEVDKWATYRLAVKKTLKHHQQIDRNLARLKAKDYVNLIKTVHRALLQNHVIGRQSSKSLSYWSAAAAVVGANCDEKGGWLFMGNGAWGNVGMRPDRNEIKNYHDNVFKKKNPPGLPPTKKKNQKKQKPTNNQQTNELAN